MVVEELVEGGLTRLAAFYYSQCPPLVGPVRSMRASDIGIVSPVKASLVTSGARHVTMRRIKGAGINATTPRAAGFYRDEPPGGAVQPVHAPQEVAWPTSRPRTARRRTTCRGAPEKDFPKGQPASDRRREFSGGHTTSWTYRRQHYVNTNSNARRRRPVPGRLGAGAAGQGGQRRLPRPGRQPRAARRFHRQRQGAWSSTTAGWCPPPGARSRPVRPLTLTTRRRAAEGAGRPRLDRAGPDAGNVTFTK